MCTLWYTIQHRTVPITFLLILQTISTVQILSIAGVIKQHTDHNKTKDKSKPTKTTSPGS